VGITGKPIMLYFSKVGIDPDTLDLPQLERLMEFKKKTYPNGLVETYKTIIEFKDKLSKQIELKVRDLQLNEASGKLPLSLEFLSPESGKPVGNMFNYAIDHYIVSDFARITKEKREKLASGVEEVIKEMSYFPVILAIENSSSSGIRNLYIELEASTTSSSIELMTYPPGKEHDIPFTLFSTHDMFTWKKSRSARWKDLKSKLTKFDTDKFLHRADQGWRLSFEWEAIQPQRTRLIKPVFYIYSLESTKLSFSVKVFADSFPEPLVLQAEVNIEARQSDIELKDILPEWEKLLQDSESEEVGP
jgi:hypothetical protein